MQQKRFFPRLCIFVPLSLLFVLLFLLPKNARAADDKYVVTVSNQNQEGTAGELLDKPFYLQVKDQNGNPVPGLHVRSACVNVGGGAKLLDPNQKTDANGEVTIRFVNGEKTKLYRLVTHIYEAFQAEPVKTVHYSSMSIYVKDIIFYVLGGLVLFLFGMRLLSDGLQSSAGNSMRSFLGMLSKNKYMGVLMGFLVTAVLQSSSITSVMLIGFVNAGIMSFTQTIGVIMGANIGTTVTGFIISIKASNIVFPLLILGFLMNFFCRSQKMKFAGQAILGLGLVFLGLKTMSTHVKPLKDSITISQAFVNFSVNPLLAVVAGLVVTFAIQSSSATLGLIITLGASGLIDLPGALGLVLGSNIGTTLTAQLASVGGNVSGHRVATMHSIFNIAGVGIMLFLMETGLARYFYKFTGTVIEVFTTNQVDIFRQGKKLVTDLSFMPVFIAFMHAVFNIANTIILLPFANALGRIIEKLLPEHHKKKFQYLEPHLLKTPSLALNQTINELGYMLKTAGKILDSATSSISNPKKKLKKKLESETESVEDREDKVDSLQKNITEYLVQLTQRQLTSEESETIPKLIHAVNDIERIGDLAENVFKTSVTILEKKLKFSKKAREDLDNMQKHLNMMILETIEAISAFDGSSTDAIKKSEETLNSMERDLRNSHISRLNSGKCNVVSGIYFLDVIGNLERIGDHLDNIAQAIRGSELS